MCHFQIEECLTALKKLSPAEAECVIERLTSWARGHLQNKDHISEEVSEVCLSFIWTKWLFVFCALLGYSANICYVASYSTRNIKWSLLR